MGVQIVVEALGVPLRFTFYPFVNIAPSEVLFSDVGHCVLSVQLCNGPMKSGGGGGAGAFYGLSIAVSLGDYNRAWHTVCTVILGVREKARISE